MSLSSFIGTPGINVLEALSNDWFCFLLQQHDRALKELQLPISEIPKMFVILLFFHLISLFKLKGGFFQISPCKIMLQQCMKPALHTRAIKCGG